MFDLLDTAGEPVPNFRKPSLGGLAGGITIQQPTILVITFSIVYSDFGGIDGLFSGSVTRAAREHNGQGRINPPIPPFPPDAV